MSVDDAPQRAHFSSAIRGYDKAQVDRELTELQARMTELEQERDQLAALADGPDLQQEIERVSKEVGLVLETAREAAEGMRQRAAAEVARWRSEALLEAERQNKSALEDAENMRSDAWDTGTELLEQVQKQAETTISASEQDSLRIRGEAEREAHRMTSSARRESDENIRTSRMEAERIMVESRSRRDEMLDKAQRSSDAAQERTRALEDRRKELLEELDSVRSTLGEMEQRLETRRDELGLSASSEPAEDATGSVRLVVPDGVEEGAEKSDSVRIVSPQPQSEPQILPQSRQQPQPSHVEPIDAETMAEEVRQMTPDNATEAEKPVSNVGVATKARVEETVTEDEVGALFDSLRTNGAAPKPIVESPEPTVRVTRAPTAIGGTDAFELRDRLLLPISNRALRGVKRQLTEIQNLALEGIRNSGADWEPDQQEIEETLRAEVKVLWAEAFGAGFSATSELGIDDHPRPSTPAHDPTGEIAGSIISDVAHVLDSAAGEDRGLATEVARVFRVWRSDEADRRLRDVASNGYHAGIKATVGEVVFLAHPKSCATCREAAANAEPPTPPLHVACGCVLSPA